MNIDHRLHEGIIIFIILNFHCHIKIQVINHPQKQRQSMAFQNSFSSNFFNCQNYVRKLLMYYADLEANLRRYRYNLDFK